MAYIVDYSIGMWDQYKELVPGPQGNMIGGMACEVQSDEDKEKLAFYETSAHEVASCKFYLHAEKERLSRKRSAERLSDMLEMHKH